MRMSSWESWSTGCLVKVVKGAEDTNHSAKPAGRSGQVCDGVYEQRTSGASHRYRLALQRRYAAAGEEYAAPWLRRKGTPSAPGLVLRQLPEC